MAYHAKFEAFCQIHFQDNKSRILAHCALATSVEKDAIGEDKVFANGDRILHTHNAMVGWLACKIWSSKDYPRTEEKIWNEM